VVVPTTFTEYTSRRVLTTSWLEGEKLSGSTASDVGELVNLGVICYLKQLLDTGFFHVRHNISAPVFFTFRIDS
jgi:aarF domain-containing kinase